MSSTALSRTVTPAAEKALERIAAELDIPPSRYESAERRYHAIGKWLSRPESKLAKFNPGVFPQGSFSLGTVIRPLNEDEHYDLDLVFESNQSKSSISQSTLKTIAGDELRAYAERHGMDAPTSGQYCWTMNYDEEAQFKVDVLPALPDAESQRLLMEAQGIRNAWVSGAVAITNNRHPRYAEICQDWQTSNPRGFSDWFRDRMRVVFEARRRTLALQEAAGEIEKIPEYRVKTPLQQAIQILKRNRDIWFEKRPDLRPASIVITTLAAHAYANQSTISGALVAALGRMEDFIENRAGMPWIPNPTDPRENFADAWAKRPELERAFRAWLQNARNTFWAALSLPEEAAVAKQLAANVGDALIERVQSREARLLPRLPSALRRLFAAPHKRAPEWPVVQSGRVRITSATAVKRGFRPFRFFSDGPALPKNCSLRFEADTNVPWPYEVYWQVVNTGAEAEAARQLRGTFESSLVERGVLKRQETTSYSGVHSIECFVVKNGYCVARSGPFVVNIE